MKTHKLKTWPEPFQAVVDGKKTYEWRKDDRGFEVGDRLLLREWDPEKEHYTGREMVVFVTYISRDSFDIPEGYCVLAIQDPSPPPREEPDPLLQTTPEDLDLWTSVHDLETRDRITHASPGGPNGIRGLPKKDVEALVHDARAAHAREDVLGLFKRVFQGMLDTDFPQLGLGRDVLRMCCRWRAIPEEDLEKALQFVEEQ